MGTPAYRSSVIKYLGSKRTLVSSIVREACGAGGSSFLDLFSGTSRVGYAMKAAGWRVIANDHNAYAHTLATCYVQADRAEVIGEVERLVAEFNAMPGRAGYFTQTYCIDSRYLKPENGQRIDAIRDAIEAKALSPEVKAVMLTSLMEAADRVDSTTGLQMAYLKQWAPRAENRLELRVPEVIERGASGKSVALMMDAEAAAREYQVDVAYVDPPYNQHSYLGNYHVWETLVRWDNPPVYGVACKRTDCRERRSDFNSRLRCAAALEGVLRSIRARMIIVSFSDEGYVARESLDAVGGEGATLRVIANDYPRYVGARIGIYNPRGEKVGAVGKLRNTEYLYVLQRSPSASLVMPSLAQSS